MEQLTGHPDGSQRPCTDRIVIWPRWNEQSGSTEFILRHLAIDRVASGYAGVPTPELFEEDILSALPEYLLPAFISIQRERLGASRTGPAKGEGSRTGEKWQSFAVAATRRDVRVGPETRHGVPLHVKVVEGEQDEWWQRGIDFRSNHPRVDARFWVEPEGDMWLAIEHRPSTMSLSCPSVNDTPAPTQDQLSSAIARSLLRRVTSEALWPEGRSSTGTINEQIASLRELIPPLLKQKLRDVVTGAEGSLKGAALFFEDVTDQPCAHHWHAAMRVY